MTTVGYARVSSTGQDLAVQLEKLDGAGCNKIFKEKRSGVDAGRPELKRCLDYLREGDTLLVTKINRLAHRRFDNRHHVPNWQAGHGHPGTDCRVRERYSPRAADGWDQEGT
jgi:DNA invertase Pin-like site-specific DNA recombinase